jgi:hypothetical protein
VVGGPKIEQNTAKRSVQAAIPLITQSDAGTENFGTANCHTTARHRLDPTLADTLQHRWMRNKTNIKSESNWSMLRRDFTPGFENLFDEGVNNGLYDASDALERYLSISVPHVRGVTMVSLSALSFAGSRSLGFKLNSMNG